jgi:hypothetical protein
MKLSLYNYFDLMIEIKDSESMFEEFSPDWLYLRVIKFVEGEKYDLTRLE